MVPARWLRILAVGGALVILVLVFPSAEGQQPGSGDKKPTDSKAGGVMEVKFTDNSTLKITLLDEKVELTTPYGKLSIPVADIQTLELATRIPAEPPVKLEEDGKDAIGDILKAME